jgi:hypothetical protein
MKKYILSLVVITALPLLSIACDICGCGVGNNYIGILPDFHKHIFGLRYRYSSLYSHIGVGGATTYLTTTERYNTIEAWGGWNISNKFRIIASVPYSFNERINQGTSQNKDGLGDITLSGYFQLLNSKQTVAGSKLLVQSLWAGGGVKLPTGKYNPADKGTANQNTNLFQLGTGSTDFIIGAMYDIRLQDAGLNVTANYKVNTANKYDYRYGSKLNVNTQAYYKINIRQKLTLAPNIGAQYETAQVDNDHKFDVSISGGNLLLGTIGVEANLKKIAIGGNWQTPLSQNLANGIVKANNRLMVHLSFML